jgi:hypothetical protein
VACGLECGFLNCRAWHSLILVVRGALLSQSRVGVPSSAELSAGAIGIRPGIRDECLDGRIGFLHLVEGFLCSRVAILVGVQLLDQFAVELSQGGGGGIHCSHLLDQQIGRAFHVLVHQISLLLSLLVSCCQGITPAVAGRESSSSRLDLSSQTRLLLAAQSGEKVICQAA